MPSLQLEPPSIGKAGFLEPNKLHRGPNQSLLLWWSRREQAHFSVAGLGFCHSSYPHSIPTRTHPGGAMVANTGPDQVPRLQEGRSSLSHLPPQDLSRTKLFGIMKYPQWPKRLESFGKFACECSFLSEAIGWDGRRFQFIALGAGSVVFVIYLLHRQLIAQVEGRQEGRKAVQGE